MSNIVLKKIKRIWYNFRVATATRQGYVKILRKTGVEIGENCEIYKSAHFGPENYLIHIGNNVRICWRASLLTHDGGLWVLRNNGCAEKGDIFGKIEIGDNVHIGPYVTIMPGVHIGKNCIVGCNAVVTHDIPDNSVAVGVPARVIETVEEYYEKNKDRIVPTKGMNEKEKREWILEHIDMF